MTPQSIQPNNLEPAVLASGNTAVEGAANHPSNPAVEFSAPDHTASPLFPTVKQAGFSRWIWLGLLISAGLHAGLLLVPTGTEAPSPSPKAVEPEKQVRITQLPKLKTATLPQKVARSAVKPVVRPVIRQQTAISIPQLKPNLPIFPEQASLPSSPSSLASSNQPTSDAGESSSWEDFPIYPGAQPGCFGLPSCLQTNDPLKQIADYYAKQLPTRKYALKSTIQEANRQVFQVSRQGEMLFLSILQTDKGQAIVLSDAPRSLDDLKKAIEVPPEVAAMLSSLAAENAKPSDFVQPDLAYTKSTEKGYASGAAVPKLDVVNISLVRSYSFDTMMSEFFRSNLETAGFKVEDQPDFGGGKLYRLNKESTTLYLSLFPSKDGDGVLLVTWETLPK